MLADERDWALFLDAADLAGLPDFLKSAMISRSASGRWADRRPEYSTEQRATIRRIRAAQSTAAAGR